MNKPESILQAIQVSRAFEEAGHRLSILQEVNLTIMRGQRVAIVGSSGSGKSTFLNTLGGLDKPGSGHVFIEGESLYEVSELQRCRIRNEKLGFVYQFHHLLNEFNALENVSMPLLLRGISIKEAAAKAAMVLNKVGLSHREKHKPGQLSGGERQRVAIARSIVTQPLCVLMDEPTGNLDKRTADEVQAYLEELNEQLNVAFVVVTHDMSLVARMHAAFLLQEGKLEPFEG